MTEVKIIDYREIPSAERPGKVDVIITFQVAPDYIDFVVLPKEEAKDEVKVKEAIKKKLEERQKWIGKTLTL